MILNLVYPDKSDIPYKVTTFSDSQVHFQLSVPTVLYGLDVVIKSRSSWSDIQVILAACASLREAYVKNILLDIPYFLGARSDRKFTEGGCNYIKDVIAPIINDLDLSNVLVLDAHSDVVEACINNLDKEDNVDLVKWSTLDICGPIEEKGPNSKYPFVLISPDAGALKKIYHVAEQIGYDGEIIVASKHRDIKTGKILSTEVPITPQHYDKDFILIDDIIDGGRTFIEIAKKIRYEIPMAKIYLIVTHGIFSAGYKELAQWFEKVYCTNSVKDITDQSIMSDDMNRGVLLEVTKPNFIKQLNVF